MVQSLGATKKPPVVVTLNGFVYRSTVAVMGGRYLIPVSAEIREGAGVTAGDEVDVELALDTEPRRVEVPADLADALAAAPALQDAFEKLSYSHQRRHVLAVEGAKAPETRQRRVDGVITTLRG
ncbi:MAG: YdeI/OmpD-associated family protein [Nakamurella sp.]